MSIVRPIGSAHADLRINDVARWKSLPRQVGGTTGAPPDIGHTAAREPAERGAKADLAYGAAPRWLRSILHTRARLHPLVTAGLMTAAALAGAALIVRRED